MTPGDALRFDGEMPAENIAAMESLDMPARRFTMPTDAELAAALAPAFPTKGEQ